MTPALSVFTPSHRTNFLDECLESLLSQDFTDWEWVIVLNGGARWRPSVEDERIRIIIDDSASGVGAAKRRACAESVAPILVELDHDDLLATTCLGKVHAAFEAHPDAVFVYSDTTQISEDGGRDESRFNEANGWVYREEEVDGQTFLAFDAMEPTPHNVAYIWFAPNHVRAFRADAYHRAGGYDANMHVLDDQDLMCRLYLQGPFVHIKEALYKQRMHALNTQRDADTNAHIQETTVALYDKYIQDLYLAWAKRNDLLALDMGAAHNSPAQYMGVDQYPGENVDIVAKLPDRLPLEDNSVGVIRAVDFLEHVDDKIALINELYRVLAPGGILLSFTPSTDGRGAFQDPTHTAFYNENSFWYYTKENIRNFVPQIKVAFQPSRLFTAYPSQWHSDNHIPYVTANLIALKPGMPRNGGIIEFSEYN